MDTTLTVAPARFLLTVLHAAELPVPGTDPGTGEDCTGWTLCNRPMLVSELWTTVEARDGDRLCAVCFPAAGPAEVQGTLI